MQSQLLRKSKKLQIHSLRERRLRNANILNDQHREVNKFYSGSNNISHSDQPKSLTSSLYDASSNDEQCKMKGLAYRQNKNKKKCRISPSAQPHAICLNHITAQPYCSIDVNEVFNTYPKYYRSKYRYVLNWLRRNFGCIAEPKLPSSNSDTTSESSDASTSDSDDTTETVTADDIQVQKKRRICVLEDSKQSSSNVCSDSKQSSSNVYSDSEQSSSHVCSDSKTSSNSS